MRVLPMFAALALIGGCAADEKPQPPPQPPSRAAAAKGLTIAEKWCTDCHRVRPEQRRVRRRDSAGPDFRAIAARPEVDAGYLRRFMEVQHLPMPTFRLYSDEQADVVAYILSLKPPR